MLTIQWTTTALSSKQPSPNSAPQTMEHKLTNFQHNLGRGKVASAELHQLGVRMKASMLLIQEPWTMQNSVCGMGTFSNRILVGTTNDTPKACIVLLDPSLDVMLLASMSNSSCVCAQVATGAGTSYVASANFPPSEPITPDWHHLRMIANRVGNAPLLLGCDLNATSQLWHARRSNPRGREIEEFLAAVKWRVANQPDQPATYASANETSNIDVTITTKSLHSRVAHWKVHTTATNRDHRLITASKLGHRVNGN